MKPVFWSLAGATLMACGHPVLVVDSGTVEDGGNPDAGLDVSADFYVAPSGRDDAGWSGSLSSPNDSGTDGPFGTLDAARRAVQALKNAQPSRTLAIVVDVRGGSYFLTSPVTFTAQDSALNTASIVYQAYPGEVPVISGGTPITGWTHGSGNAWTASIDSAQYQYFEQLFVGGERRFRPRTTPTSYLYNAGPVLLASPSPPNCPANPDGGLSECYDRFYYGGTDLDAGWTNATSPYPAGDIEIDDFENWTMAVMRLSSIDPITHIAYLTGPTTKNPTYGFLPGHRYLVDNVKDALTQPGQWFLDRSATPWTLTYLAEPGETDLNAMEVVAPQLQQVLTAQSLSGVTFRGLTFSHSNWTVPPEGHLSQQAEPLVGAAISLNASSNITFDGCTVSHVGGWGLEFAGASNGNQVLNGELTDLGAGGVRLGTTAMPGDTDANIPQGNLVQNNIVTATGRTLPAGGGVAIWLGNSHHNLVTHNEVYDSYGGGIGNNVPAGNPHIAHDNVFSFNHVHDINRGIMRDGGAIYLATLTNNGNQVLNNKVHDVWADPGTPSSRSYGGWGIYLDNGTSNVLVQNNLVYRCGSSTFFNHDGVMNSYLNNIFAYGRLAMMQSGQYEAAQLTFTSMHNLFYFDMGALQAKNPWDCFGGPCSSVFDLDYNLYWSTGAAPSFRNTNSGGTPTSYTFPSWQASVLEDVHSQVAGPGFNNPVFPADDYTLRDGSPALEVGFVPFDVTAPGRTAATLNPPDAPPGFPLQLADPATDF